MATRSNSYLRSQLSVNNSIINEKYGLIIYPPKLEFSNVAQNESSSSVISIQNVSKTLKKIRIVGVPQKHKSLFTIHASNSYKQLASGCSVDIPITFLSKAPLTQSIYTELRIGIKDRMKDGLLSIEMIAKVPSSNIDFESILDFNTVTTQQSFTKQLLLKNIGAKKGFYECQVPNAYKSQISIQAHMLRGELDPNQSTNIPITITTADKLGILRCSIDVIIDNDKSNTKTLEIICNVCEHKINFLMPKTKSNIEQINFGHLYFGQKRSFKGLLINNGPKAAHYSLYLKPYKDIKKKEDENNENNNTHYAPTNKKNKDAIDDQEQDVYFDEDSVPINIDHEEGTLAAYESKLISITFTPEIKEKLKGFRTTHNPKDDITEMKLLLVIESAEIIQIPLSGVSFPVLYQLSQTRFDFGECAVHDRRDVYVELRNDNKWMSLHYKFSNIACFHTSPSMATLQPLQSANILLTFCPKQLGNFKKSKIKLIFNNNAKTFDEFVVSGSTQKYNSDKSIIRNHFGRNIVGGTDKLPVDFKPTIKIINEKDTNKSKEVTAVMKEISNLQFQTQMPAEISARHKPNWNTSTSTKGLYPSGSHHSVSIVNAADESTPNLHYTFSTMDTMKRYSNKEESNKYIKTMRQERNRKYFEKENKATYIVAEAKEDEDPETNIERDQVDIGLKTFHGLNEPRLDLPDANINTLYLGDGQKIDSEADRLNFFKKCMNTKYNKKGSITKMEENKLIKQKFKSVPETSAEIIDCQATLTRKELKELQYGPKCMDFGKLCIHSQSTKNFSIVNTLKKTILVEVKVAPENAQQIVSHPVSQVIPSQQMAGFDIIFNAMNVGILEEELLLLINGIHTISFKLNAEIISMDLSLSADKLKFEFPVVDYLDFSLVQNITLSNVLTAPTKYKFDTQSITKDMTIKPESGTIAPNKTQSIQFIWSPTTLRAHHESNKSQESDRYHVKLQIVDGFDKMLEIESVLPFSKCTLTNKTIDFNTIAIGTEHTKRVQIKNIGHIQSVFRIIRCPSNLSIHPLCGKIDVGTSLSLSVTYLSLTPQSFNENVIIEVRGGQTLKLNVIAKTIVPEINITQSEFDFSGVTIGDTKSLAIEIANTSSVSAHLFLEMTANDLYPNTTFDILYPNEWNDLATEPTKAPIIPLPPNDEDELHSLILPGNNTNSNPSHQSSRRSLRAKQVQFSIPSSRRSSRRSLRRKPSMAKSIAADQYVRIVRSLENPNLLHNEAQHSSYASLNKTPQLNIDIAAPNKIKKKLNSPMMRRGSLMAMGQHLIMMKEVEQQVENSECSGASKSKDIDDEDAKEEIRYRILVAASSTLRFKLVFHPQEMGEYDFDLNLSMAGVVLDDCLLRKCVFGSGLKPRIALSTRNVSFFDVTVSSEYEKQIVIHNEESNTIQWQLNHKMDERDHNPWKIVPNHGVLEALGSSKVAICFSPQSDALFKAAADLILSGSDGVYVSIDLEGQASYPRLTFNEEFLLLPTVPLNCKSTKMCIIRNQGYENLEIRYEIIDDKAASFIHLSFPNGRIIGGNGPDELKVEISLLSAVSVSFTTRIDFVDMDSNRFSIFVSAMADNCVLTNQPFLCNNEYKIGVCSGDSDIVSKLKVLKRKKKSTTWDASNLIPDDIPTNILSDVSVLIRYLEANCYLKFDSNIDNFPADLLSSNGQMVIDLVEFLSGKKIPGFKSTKQKNTDAQLQQAQIERLIHNYAQLINFLKAHAALITIRPEFLLNCTQYIKFIQISSTMSSQPPSSTKNKFNELKSSKSHSDMQKLKKQSEMIHPMISYVSWTQLLFQIVKLFVLNKTTFQRFIQLQDIAELIENEDPFILKYVSNQNVIDADDQAEDVQFKLMEDRLMTSNVYSMHENLLLLWISVHYNKMSTSKTFFEHFSELSDGIALVYLLQSYAPHISELERVRTRTPLTEQDKTHNASLIIQSMKKLGLNIAIICDDITKPIERNMCLLILYLYQHLPDYAANNKKNIIPFNGNLNEEIVRKIHIKNPSKTSKICYEISMSGDPLFELQTSSFIVLAPNAKKSKSSKKKPQKQRHTQPNSRLSTARTTKSGITEKSAILQMDPETDVIVSYTPRFIRPSTARLTLLAKPFPDAIFPTLVPETISFELKSSFIESKPIKTIECKGKLYESSKVQFEVTNPYSINCEFNVIIKNMSDTQEAASIDISPWHCDKKTIKIKANQTVEFTIEYLPFNMGKHLCCITFMDHKYGEFLYNIVGESLLPKPIDDIQLQCKDTESISHEINLNKAFKNPLLETARHIATDRARKTAKDEPQNVQQTSLQSNPCIYNIHVSSPFFVAPKQLKLYDDEEADNRLLISFNPKGAGSYPCVIKLESHPDSDNIGDIRIYNIQVTAQSEGTHAELEFNAHANERVIQKIPIVNTTASDWRITSEIIGEAARDFNTERQKEFVVASKSTAHYNLIYGPQWISSNVSAQLILHNHATAEEYIYDLNCTSKEPLAKDHIVLECQAKACMQHEFEIENPYYPKQSVQYKVESDLTAKGISISGDADIGMDAAQKSRKYVLSITPQCGGNIHGSVSFIEENSNSQKFVWYAMELVCSSPEPEKIIKISAYLRQVVAVEINLSNPLKEMIEFDVNIIGEGLFGENKFILQAQEASSIYKLHYSPLITGEIKGSISFSSEVSGEFWYSLVLIGKKAPSIQLKDMVCSVGNVCYQDIVVENPFNERMTLNKDEHIMLNNKDTNSTSFYLNNGKSVAIPALCKHPITLVYRPSLIGIKQMCEIILKHPKLGEWNYNVLGLGKEPNIEKQTFIYAVLHSRISKVISFTNPFDQILKIKIELESNCEDSIFQLFMKRKKSNNINTYNVTPNSSLQIPVFFSPNTMKQYTANLVVSANNVNQRELVWNYPIIGLSEYKSSQLLSIKCNARETFHKIWSVELDNYHFDQDGNEDEFSIEIENKNKNEIIDKSLSIDLIKRKLNKTACSSQNVCLQIEVLFEPLRAFNETSILHVTNKQGVRWIFQLNFVVNKAKVDDVIKIQSQLHCTSSVCFGLDLLSPYNEAERAAAATSTTFRAYFTPISPFEFDVSPKKGVIQNESEAIPQQFVVSFTPNEYGSALNGTLIIETQIMEWSYRVVGTHPTYIPPNIKKFKPTVDDKISKKIQIQRQKGKNIVKNRNFLKKNISATRK